MALTHIRSRIEALERKFALPLAVVRARRVADQICEEWTVAQANNKPLLTPQQCVRRMADAHVSSKTFSAFHRYIERCITGNDPPGSKPMLQALLPGAAFRGPIESVLRWDASAA